ncbi:MAG: DUF2147 domain-containing protein [Stappiaceae bacterium]
MRIMCFAAVMMVGFAGSALAADVSGTWKTASNDKGYLYVTIAPCGGKTCGTIADAFSTSGQKDASYKYLGKQIIWDMQAKGGGAFDNGKVWSPAQDKTYPAKMTLSGDSLEVDGCAAGGLVCRGQTWTRVK